MAKVLLVDLCEEAISPDRPLGGYIYSNLGLAVISAVLKENGHSSSAVVLGTPFAIENERIIKQTLEKDIPDIVGISAMFNTFDYAASCAALIKKIYPTVKIIIGGPHVSLNPQIAFNGSFDAICIGEGEFPMVEYANAVDAKNEEPTIKNIWIRDKKGKWKESEPRPFIPDLDKLPFPDTDIWTEYIPENWLDVPYEQHVVLIGRGCPFLCTFCSNHELRKLSKGKYVRFKTPERICAEVRSILSKHPALSRIYFEVETIAIKDEWILNLCDKIKALNDSLETPIEFSTNYRIIPKKNHDNIFYALKKAGFTRLNIGLESGSERVRNEIMNRNYSNSDVLYVVDALHRAHLKFRFNNMVGLPGETFKDYLDTVKMNRLCNPDEYNCVIFEPYPGTQLYEVCKEQNVQGSAGKESSRWEAQMQFPTFSRNAIQYAFDTFSLRMAIRSRSLNLIIRLADSLLPKLWGFRFVRLFLKKTAKFFKQVLQ